MSIVNPSSAIRTGLSVPVFGFISVLVIDVIISVTVEFLLRRANSCLNKWRLIKNGKVQVGYGIRATRVFAALLVALIGAMEFGVDAYLELTNKVRQVKLTGMFRENSPPVAVFGDAEANLENEVAFTNTTKEGFKLRYKAAEGYVEALELRNCIFDRIGTKECQDNNLSLVLSGPIRVSREVLPMYDEDGGVFFVSTDNIFLNCYSYVNSPTRDYTCTGLLKVEPGTYKSYWDAADVVVEEPIRVGDLVGNVDLSWNVAEIYYNLVINEYLPGQCEGVPFSCSIRVATGGGTSWDSVRASLLNGALEENVEATVLAQVFTEVARAEIKVWVIWALLAVMLTILLSAVLIFVWNGNQPIALALEAPQNISAARVRMSGCNSNVKETQYWTIREKLPGLFHIDIEAEPNTRAVTINKHDIIDGEKSK